MIFLQTIPAEAELLYAIEADLKLLSAELSNIWQQFLEMFRSCEFLIDRLLQEHHQLRLKRFAEGYFFSEDPAQMALSYSGVGNSVNLQSRVADFIRKSPYFLNLPDLPVFCPETDGNFETLPIVFEEKFQPNFCPNSGRSRQISTSSSSGNFNKSGLKLDLQQQPQEIAAVIEEQPKANETEPFSKNVNGRKAQSMSWSKKPGKWLKKIKDRRNTAVHGKVQLID